MKYSRRLHGVHLALAALIVANIAAQIIIMHKGLDNEPVNQAAPDFFDAFSYAGKAQALAHHGSFRNLFGDGYTMPGYSVLVSLPCRVFKEPLKMTRYFQVVAGSLLILLAFAVFSKTLGAVWPAFAASLIVAAWFPFYHFAQVLYPESASFVLVALAAAFFAVRWKRPALWVVALSFCLAVLVYLKPNHILVFLPLASVVWAKTPPGSARMQRTLILCAIMAVTVVALIAPWSVWISRANHTFIPLTTGQGYNLYLGTGALGVTADKAGQKSMPQRAADRLCLRDPGVKPMLDNCADGTTSHAEENTVLAKKARERWRGRPFALSAFGAAKVLHAFGFSFRDLRDAALALMWLLAMAVSVVLWRTPVLRQWCLFFWAMTAMAALQAFFFLPAQRFKAVLVDFPALCVIGLGIGLYIKTRRWPVSK
jgi:hypothetical protein